jgi:hypothetical protein
MQLTKLEIKGFQKPFFRHDKITINFNEGVTAIVGPMAAVRATWLILSAGYWASKARGRCGRRRWITSF